jgi:hypothetical protein
VGELRFGDRRYLIRAPDVIGCHRRLARAGLDAATRTFGPSAAYSEVFACFHANRDPRRWQNRA